MSSIGDTNKSVKQMIFNIYEFKKSEESTRDRRVRRLLDNVHYHGVGVLEA
jgi:hypothetical protein